MAFVTPFTVSFFENNKGDMQASTMDAIQSALESAGVEFIPSNGGGPGVRLKS